MFISKNTILDVPAEDNAPAELTTSQWDEMKEMIASSKDFTKLRWESGLEFRFIPMEKQTFSALLSYQGLDVFHFMWTEVKGVVDIDHRIVNPKYRGKGIASQVMEAIQQRVQALANADELAYFLMMETSQLSVIKFGAKMGMKLTKGRQIFDEIQSGDHGYGIDENTHITDQRNYRLIFRVSQLFQPVTHQIARRARKTRTNIHHTIYSKVA